MAPTSWFSMFDMNNHAHPTKDRDLAEETVQRSQQISIKEYWREFMKETSLHGCNHIIMVRRHWTLTRYLWVILVIGMGSALGIVLVQLYIRYKEYPFKTVWNVKQERSVVLPSFTFCLPSNLDISKANKSALVFDYISKKRSFLGIQYFFEDYEEMETYLNRTETILSNMSLSEFTKISKFSTQDIFKFLSFNGKDLIEGDGELELWLPESRDRSKSCWVLNGGLQNRSQDRPFTRFDSIELVIDVKSHRYAPDVQKNGMEIFVHENHTNHFLEKSFLLRPGSYTQIFFSRIEHKFLPLPYRSFGNQDCIQNNHDEFSNPLKMWPRYSMNSCIWENMIIRTAYKCKCVYVEYKHFFPNFSECSIVEFENCFVPMADKFLMYFLVEDGAKSIGCLPECTFNTFDLSSSTASFPSKNSIGFFQTIQVSPNLEYARENLVFVSIGVKDESVNVIEHVPEVTLLSIFGIVGGYMGLFLGASLLTLTEFFERVIFSAWMLIRDIICYRKIS